MLMDVKDFLLFGQVGFFLHGRGTMTLVVTKDFRSLWLKLVVFEYG